MSLSHLPCELLDLIARALDHDRRALLAFSSCCSTLRDVAQPILYRHVSITGDSKTMAVVDVLQNKASLARLVRSLSLVAPTTLSLAYGQSLSNALSQMRDLESLKLTIDPAMSWVLPDASGITFPRLRTFTCVFPLDHNVTTFLAKTDSLEHLELGHDLVPGAPTHEVHFSWLPRLSSFAGSSQAAQAIIPGRPVSSISMHSGDLTEVTIHAFSKSTAAVLLLDATTASLPLPLLEAMAIAIPELQELRLATTYNLWDEWFNTPFIQNIKDALINMNNLKTAEVSGMLWRWLNKEGRVLANEPRLPPPMDDDTPDGDFDDASYFHA